MAESRDPRMLCYLVDTRKLWLVGQSATPKGQMVEFEGVAARALSLLTEEERQAVLRYYHVRDAKMSLASHLLKHFAITKLCKVGWHDSTISRDEHGKPCYIPGSGKMMDFNVSHQAGLVSLIAAASGEVGTDVVCVNERNERATIDRDGFFNWVDMHADVFAPAEVQSLKFDASHLNLHPQVMEHGRDAIARCQYRHPRVSLASSGGAASLDSSAIIEAKLRRFFALWCLREAYVKMTGEALLADWLRNLEFRNWRAPASRQQAGEEESLATGEVIGDFEIYLGEKRVDRVAVELRAIGQAYMIASAVRCRDTTAAEAVVFPGYDELDVEKDIYPLAS
ncbi:MAG: hypothetical protein M1818_002793 [Claussenomyces sp. TS43310]|nr:MAG: hypothetical protein M1818_002793 [Claussenomyces sp. TS43310]